MAEKAKRNATLEIHRGRYRMFGQSITSVLRTIGKMGMHHTTAVNFLESSAELRGNVLFDPPRIRRETGAGYSSSISAFSSHAICGAYVM